ncbi:hypothetical protein HDU97_002617 [Phlyctochytrium planicorne]|nr:hypothetical protein HDU97_002617 [Phlyctochytrium planicorne]
MSQPQTLNHNANIEHQQMEPKLLQPMQQQQTFPTISMRPASQVAAQAQRFRNIMIAAYYGLNRWTFCNSTMCVPSKGSACSYVEGVSSNEDGFNNPSEAGSFCNLDRAFAPLLYTALGLGGILTISLLYLIWCRNTNTVRAVMHFAAGLAIAAFALHSSCISLLQSMMSVPLYKNHNDLTATPYPAYATNVVSTALFLACGIIIILRSRHQPLNEEAKRVDQSSYAQIQPNIYGQPVYGQPQVQYYPAVQPTQFVYAPAVHNTATISPQVPSQQAQNAATEQSQQQSYQTQNAAQQQQQQPQYQSWNEQYN